MLKKYLKHLGLAAGLLLFTALIVQQGWFLGFQRELQNVFYDSDQASSEIIIVAIDETSLKEDTLGNLSQWPRAYYAEAIELLSRQNAAVIGVDITFPNRSTKGQEDDQVLAEAIERHDNVILATHFQSKNGEQLVEWPHPTLLESNPRLGWINIMLGEDGFVRELPVFADSERGIIEAFSVAVSRVYLNADPENYRIKDNVFAFSDEVNIPVNSRLDVENAVRVNSMHVNYFAKPDSYTHVSFSDLLNGNWVNQGIDFRDKIVLIGPTATDLQDEYLSPVSDGVMMPGVEIHANAIQTIISGEFLTPMSPHQLWVLLLILLIVNLILFSFLRVRFTIPLMIIEVIGLIVSGILAYEWGYLLNVVYPIIVVLLSFMGMYLLRFILEQKKRKFIESAFGRYVNKEVVKQIQANPDMLKLGGVKRDLTVFFSDIAGFTSISEQMDPETLVSFLNEYLGHMTDLVLKRQGTLDKYEGDAIMAFWNAPLPQHDHPLDGCLAALEQQRKLSELRQKWMKSGLPEMHVRMGINTGTAVVGNMGSQDRFNYTAMGDNVNLASRLESINKQYGTYILMAEATHEAVKEALITREIDQIRVKGKKEAVRIYELLGETSKMTDKLKLKITLFAEGLSLYRAQKFEDAKQTFQQLANDAPAQVFIERCDAFIKKPPAADWDGVWNFEVK